MIMCQRYFGVLRRPIVLPFRWPKAHHVTCKYYYLCQPSPSANKWSPRHWQITIFCSTSSIIVNCVSEYRDCEKSLFCSKITFLYSPYMAVPPTPAGVYLYFLLVINEVKSIFASLERKNETFVLRPEIKRTVNAKFRAPNANIKSRIFCTHRQNKSRQHKFQMHFQEVLFYLLITRTFNR